MISGPPLGRQPPNHSGPTQEVATTHIMRSNTKTLIATLHQDGLCNRFSQIRVVNRDPETGEMRRGHQGVLSVVFRAHDTQTGHDIALKFFDPDYQGLASRYRMDLFEREAKLLERLQGKLGLLQLVKSLSEIQISATQAGESVTLTCMYFAIQWLDGDIEAYFLRQDDYDALVKLALFREIVLGVFRLHRQQIAHRDIKPDNLRHVQNTSSESLVVPIDLGTAIDLHSRPVGTTTDYQGPVGAGAFSPLEAQLGLAGLREMARATDIYALGCLLHDLFNADYYNVRLSEDPGFASCFFSCRAYLMRTNSDGPSSDAVLVNYNYILKVTKHQVNLPSIDSEDTTVPNAARDPLNRLLGRLAHIDYSQREYRLDNILHLLDRATANLRNHLMEGHKRRILEKHRSRHQTKLEANQARLQAYLQNQHSGGIQC